ncbi:TPA: hypothetical protein JLO99_002711 [Escherichia coli]|nr:hypothetical protein [Escherichia coli]
MDSRAIQTGLILNNLPPKFEQSDIEVISNHLVEFVKTGNYQTHFLMTVKELPQLIRLNTILGMNSIIEITVSLFVSCDINGQTFLDSTPVVVGRYIEDPNNVVNPPEPVDPPASRSP